MTTFLIILAVASVALLGGYLWLRARRPVKEEEYYHFKCPGCGRKLRYRASQKGHEGMCPRCNQRWTFPTSPGRGAGI
jgi:hypothetical protein